jgi:hypothetical protein
MPAINGYLQDGLKWLRETDAATGGLVKTSIAWAGAGILVAAGLGALGVILPILGAGLSAVGALISPFGLALAAVAAGAMYIYRNWNTYGPRLTQLWQRAKVGFFRFADDMKERGGRIVAAGREMVSRYAPIIRAGFASAWQDVKAGLKNIQPFFESFKNALNFKFDLSGLTIDDAKIATFKALDMALKGIAVGWQALKDFGSGYAPHLAKIGENLGQTVNAIVEIASGFERLARALGQMMGFDAGKMSGFFKGLGDAIGTLAEIPSEILRDAARIISMIVNGLASLVETVNAGVKWENLLPQSVIDAWNTFAGVVERVKAAVNFGGSLPPGTVGPNGDTVAATDDHLGNDWTTLPPQIPANSNQPGLAPAQRPINQQVQVGGTVNIKVDGPGTVTGISTENSSVPITANTGRAVGRN